MLLFLLLSMSMCGLPNTLQNKLPIVNYSKESPCGGKGDLIFKVAGPSLVVLYHSSHLMYILPLVNSVEMGVVFFPSP